MTTVLDLAQEATLFAGQTVIVTGSAQGLGLQIAASFAARGANVVMADLNEEGVQKAAVDMDAQVAGQVVGLTVDVTNESLLTSMVEQTLHRFGSVEHLVNNAGTLIIDSLVDTAPPAFERLLAVNVTGVYLGMRAVLPSMLANGRGSIINLSSLAGKKAMPQLSAYCASKAAVLSLTQTTALEVAPTVRVNAVCPGVVNTPMQQIEYKLISERTGQTEDEIRQEWLDGLPMGTFQQPLDIAEAVCFLASARACQITGEAVAVNGGLLMD